MTAALLAGWRGRAGIIAGGLLILVRNQKFARLISVENSGIIIRK